MQITSHEDVKRFLTAGAALITVVSKKTGNRFTYRVVAPKKDKTAGIRWVKLLTGPQHYSYIGNLLPGTYTHGRKSKIGSEAQGVKAFAWFVKALESPGVMEQVEVYHSGKCGCCGRPLTVPESIRTGIGPKCAGRIQ